MQKESIFATLWRFVRPEPEELVVYLFGILVLMGIAGYHVAVQGQAGPDSQDLIASFANIRESFYGFFNTRDAWGRFFLFGLWFCIGTVTYVIAWSLITMLVDLSNDIRVSSSFIHPKSFHQSDYWASIAGRVVLRSAAGIALVFYGVFWIVGFAPIWLHAFQIFFGHGASSKHITNFVLALIGTAITLHLGAILLRLMLLKAHYKYDD